MAGDNPGGGLEHVDQGEDKDAPLNVGGGSGAGAGLPPPGAVVAAGGIGEDGPAGDGPDAPVAAAGPAVMALLQQLLASNQSIAISLNCVENQQAQPQQQ